MKRRNKFLFGVLILALALSLMPAMAFAQGGPEPDQPPVYRIFPGKALIRALTEAAAQALSMTPVELKQALRQGQTPGELLQEHNVSREQLADAMQQVWNAEGEQIIDQFIEQGLPPRRAPLAEFGRLFRDGRQWMQMLADELGMSVDDVGKALRSGQSLEAIAQAQGKTVQEVVDAILAVQKARLDQAVADGKLTREQADAIYNRISEKANAWASKTLPPADKRPNKAVRAAGMWVQAAADVLNMPVDEFVQAMREGQTPAQIAEAHGSSAQALVDSIIAAQREQMQQAVDAGTMTQDRMDRILKRVSKTLSRWVERGGPQPRSRGW